MTKYVVGTIFLIVLIFGVSGWVTYTVFKHDEKIADETCAKLGAVPNYTYRTRFICVTPDGRVVE